MRFACIASLPGILLTGCTDPVPVPSDKAEYVGLWVASDRTISIFAAGRLEYRKKLRFGMHNRIEGDFTFAGNTLDVGVLRSFVINQPPVAENGQWIMVIDGISYERTGPPTRYGRSHNWPAGLD